MADEIARLKKLYDDSVITKEQFEAQKRSFLMEIRFFHKKSVHIFGAICNKQFCMKPLKLLIPLFLLTQLLAAQKTIINEYAAIDKKALQLPDSSAKTTTGIANYISSNFTSNTDKVRAIFIWTASNIDYDLDNMYAIDFYETTEQKINKALTTHKGICENYTAVFNDVCSKTGIKSYVIEGYTKQNGFTDYIPHAWSAAYIDTAWFMFDPTWGSGYVANATFHKKINNDYFKAKPAALIKTHMPFDYLWQFLYYPITNAEFYAGKTIQDVSKPFFNYKDSLTAYEQQTHIQQLTAEADRIQRNGLKNSMIFQRLQDIKIELENEKITAENNRRQNIVNLYNTAAQDYNDGVPLMNKFIDYRNHQFAPEKTDAEIQHMIDTANTKIDDAKKNLRAIENPDDTAAKTIEQLRNAIVDLDDHIKEQQTWLTDYFSKSKSKRKQMFYEKKITFFGKPIN